MAIVEYSIKDLEGLIGRKLSKSDLEEAIPMMGSPLERIDGDRAWFEVFPNRPDLLSAEGFARAVRLFLGGHDKLHASRSGQVLISVSPTVKPVRPFISAAVIRNVHLTRGAVESLMQVQEKLHETLGRKRRKVAIGVHDLDKVKPPFTYKAVGPKSVKFVPLGKSEPMDLAEICKRHEKGQAYAHILQGSKAWPVITDANGDVLSFPPIINGELTRVTERTKNIFVDVTGTSRQAVDQALNIITTSLAERGFSIESATVDGRRTPDLAPSKIKATAGYVNGMLGTKLKDTDMKKLLARMGISYSNGVAMVPAYRTDVMHSMDIAEDVAIAYGYQKLVPLRPRGTTIAKRLRIEEATNTAKAAMAGIGFQEVKTMVLTNDGQFSRMGTSGSAALVSNSVTAECNQCRAWLLPSMLRVLSQNMHVEYPQRIFEAGDCITLDKKEETGARLERMMAAAISGNTAAYEDISAALSALFGMLGAQATLTPADHGTFIRGRCAKVVANGKAAGFVGEVKPDVLSMWGIEKPVAAFELNLKALFA